MAILTCTIPNFALGLVARGDEGVLRRAVALVGAEERVVEVSAAALAAGVRLGQTARQARVVCGELETRQVDLRAAEAEFEAVVGVLERFSERVEPAGLGRVFVDVPDVKEGEATEVCREVGRQVRGEVGATLEPAIGCDSGKFTAEAAASRTQPGRVRVVLGAAERPFLRPLPVGLLPLPRETLVRLGYLGIRSLGQYADLPPKAVVQQFGLAGRTAQTLARGEDRRPVVPRGKRPNLTVGTQFEPGLETLEPLVMAAIRLLEGPTEAMAGRLQGAQTMRATLGFETGTTMTEQWAWTRPTAERGRLGRLLAQRWEGQRWEGRVTSLTVTLGEIGDLVGEQGMLGQGLGAGGWGPGEERKQKAEGGYPEYGALRRRAEGGRRKADTPNTGHLVGRQEEGQAALGELVGGMRVRFGGEGLLRAAVTSFEGLRVEGRVVWGEWGG